MQIFPRNLSISIAIIVGSIVVFAVVLSLLAHALSGTTERIVALRAHIVRNQTLVQTLSNMKQISGDMGTYKDKIALLLPGSDQLIEFPKQINALAKMNQVGTTLSMDENLSLPGDGPGSWGFSIIASGSFQNILSFMKALERDPGHFAIGIDTVGISQDQTMFRASISGKVFYQ